MFGLDNLIDMLFETAMESINRNERVIQLLKRLNLNPDHPPADFTGVYQYALVEYGVGKSRPVIEIFRQTKIQELFREALERNTPTILLKNGEDFLADHPLQADLQAHNVDIRREFYAFAAVFIEVAKRTRTPAEILAEQKLESLHRQIGSLQERLNRLPTIEGMRTEMARLAAQDYPALPRVAIAPATFSAEQCKAFALAQQMRGWFETLGFRFESHEVWQDDYFEWIVNIPVRRGRYDRILVRGIDGEAGLPDVQDLRQAVATHRTDEGWLVTARRISRAARDEVEKPENDALGCFTFDELLDQDADFSGYLTWLESEIEQLGIDQKYVPLACLKEEIDPDTRQRIGVSRYDDRDGWIDGYIDLWLDDPAKEHISVLGEFGTGKTWFAFHYAWKALQRYRDAQRRGLERPRLPLVVPLRDYAKAVSVESLFSEFFFRKHEIPIPGYSAFEQLNRMGKLLLIFDGFDEMAARVDRQQMINNFWELAKVVVPGAKVILTCRTEHFPEAKEGRALLNAELQASTKDLTGETPQFEVLELEKFNDEQIRQVLSHQAQPATVEQIMGNPELLDLARRPVLTELILEALPDIEAGKPVDMSRVYLYAVRHKMERDIKAERTFTSMADKLYFMCELSWEMLSTDRMSINYREFPDRIRKLFGPAVEEEKDLDHWHYDMMGQTMLIRNAEGDYTPAHRSLLEFFVAYKFARELKILSKDFSELTDSLNFSDNFDLSSTFGLSPLPKAILDLILPMLNTKTSSTKLLEIILQTKHKSKFEVRYVGGNALTILLRINPYFIENLDLSKTVIAGSDWSNISLRNVDVSESDLSEVIFSALLGTSLSVKFSPDSRYFVNGEANGIVRLWAMSDDSQIIIQTQHTDWVSAVDFSPDGKLLITASHDRTLKLWNIETGELLRSFFGHTGQVRAVAFTLDGKKIISGSDDLTIRVWDAENGLCLHCLEGHKGWIRSVIPTPDGLSVASSSNDKTVRFWSLETGECFKHFLAHTDWISSIDVTPDNQFLISASDDHSIRIWDIHSGERIKVLQGHQTYVNAVKVSSDSKKIISGDDDGILKIWDIESSRCVETLQKHTSKIRDLDISKDNTYFISAGSTDLRLWNFLTGDCIKTCRGSSHWVNSVAVSSDGKHVVLGGEDLKLRVWSPYDSGGKLDKYLQGHSRWISSVVINPKRQIAASGSGDHTIKLWNIRDGNCLTTFKKHEGNIHALAADNSGSLLASASRDNTIALWNFDPATSEKPVKLLLGHRDWVNSVSFNPDSLTLISGSSDKNIKLWDIESGNCIKSLSGHEDCIWTVAFSPSGDLFASGSDDCNIKIWDSTHLKCIKTLRYHKSRVNSVTFNSNGEFLATAGLDGVINLWNPYTGQHLRSLEGHANRVQSIVFNQINNHLISCSYDETVRIWDIENGKCIKTLSNRPYAGTNISGAKGLDPKQIERLKVLGAVEK
ncbi:NACHT and WD40 repeat domain-containing protein [Sphaerothrix gracilis]|uniref:NACHT and WD40 repeat domain-containing protein n=1 Tax=Sphaerothrix gracilis TaxID=3151835 RepID=UPI0031FC2C97